MDWVWEKPHCQAQFACQKDQKGQSVDLFPPLGQPRTCPKPGYEARGNYLTTFRHGAIDEFEDLETIQNVDPKFGLDTADCWMIFGFPVMNVPNLWYPS